GAFGTSLVGGQDAFLTKVNPDGSALAFSTYLGGSSNDQGNGVAVDPSGRAWVAGTTSSSGFPTQGAFQSTHNIGQDAFVSRFKADGSGLEFSSFLGGGSDDYGNGITLDGAGNAYVVGSTVSSNFPTTAGAFQTANAGGLGSSDAFVTKVTAAGALGYSTYL